MHALKALPPILLILFPIFAASAFWFCSTRTLIFIYKKQPKSNNYLFFPKKQQKRTWLFTECENRPYSHFCIDNFFTFQKIINVFQHRSWYDATDLKMKSFNFDKLYDRHTKILNIYRGVRQWRIVRKPPETRHGGFLVGFPKIFSKQTKSLVIPADLIVYSSKMAGITNFFVQFPKNLPRRVSGGFRTIRH